METALVVSNIVLWVVVLILGVTVLALLRQVGVIYERIAPAGALSMNQRLNVGDAAPAMELTSIIDDAPVHIAGEQPEQSETMLFFFGTDCPVCKVLLPVVRSLSSAEAGVLRVVLASDGDDGELRDFVHQHSMEHLPCVSSRELGMAYGVAKLPYAVLIGADQQIKAYGLVNSREHLESLLEASERNIATLQEYLDKTQL